MEAEAPGFEEVGLFVGFDGLDFLDGEGFEPFEVAVGLGGDEDEPFVIEAEDACGALFGLEVVGGDPVGGIAVFDFEGGEAWFGALDGGGLGVEEVAVRFADVLGEDAAGDGFGDGAAGDEEVDARGAEVDRPGDRFRPWAGDEVEGQHGEGVLEHLVEFARVAEAMFHQVEVVIGVDRGELSADHEGVAMADEDGFDSGEFFGGFHGDGRRGRGREVRLSEGFGIWKRNQGWGGGGFRGVDFLTEWVGEVSGW